MICERLFCMFTPKQSSTSVLFALCLMLFCLHSKRLLACDEIVRLKAGNGTLLSEEKLDNFSPTSCIWEIEAPLGYRIELVVRVFEIKTSCCSCREDYVEFRDGLNSTSPFIGRYCANKKPIRVYSSQNVLRVQYFSSAPGPHANLTSVNKFKASYGKICGQFFRGESGEISSPPYPNFTSIARCLFTIVVPYGWVKVTFTNFTVGMLHMHSDRCGRDFVMVKEMAFVELKHTARGPESLCGVLKSPYMFSSGQELSLLYHMSQLFNSSFVAKFEATNKSLAPCGGLVTNTAGYIYSYNYPMPYPRDTECVWKIEVPYGYIKLQFLVFNFTLASKSSCMDGQVEIYDGWSSNSVKIQTYCGQLPKYTWVKSRSHRLLIKATSKKKANLQTGTFILSYSLVEQGLCLSEEFCCTSRECVNQEAICDGIHDCSDGSDELNCPQKKANKALYVLWVLIVFIASVLMVIWLWRTWRKAVHHTVHVRRDNQENCPNAEDYACEVPFQSGAPPTYSEALNDAPASLPSYEEALLNDNDRVILERGNTVQFLARSDSCNHHLLPTYDLQTSHSRPDSTRQSLAIV